MRKCQILVNISRLSKHKITTNFANSTKLEKHKKLPKWDKTKK